MTDKQLTIAVSSQNRKQVTQHAGKCRKFWLYHVVDNKTLDKTLIEMTKEQSFSATKEALPAPLQGIDVLITGGCGEGLPKRLAKFGIKTYVTETLALDEAVAAYLAEHTA